MIRCLFGHRWLLIERIRAERAGGLNVSGVFVDDSTIQKAVHGQTTLIFQCQDCRTLRREECLGLPPTAATEHVEDMR